MIVDELAGFDRGRRTGLDIAANIAASMGYFAVARAIRAGGNDALLEALLRERSRTVVAESALMAGAFCSILVERRRQDQLFPGELLIDGTGATEPLRVLAAAIRRAGDELNHTEKNSFAHVLAEEVLEAFVETDLGSLRCEVVQVGAVAVKWIEDIDRRMRR